MNASSDNSAAIVKPAQASVIRFANPRGLSIAGGTTGQSATLVTVNIRRSVEGNGCLGIGNERWGASNASESRIMLREGT